MATGLVNRFNAAQDSVFLQRVDEAMTEAAVAIYNEANTIPSHAVRAAYATKILNARVVMTASMSAINGYTPAFAAALVTQGIDNSDVSAAGDTAIANGVAAVWNALAGV